MSKSSALSTYLTRVFNGSVIRQRESDGFVDATSMCKAGGKLIGHWKDTDQTREFLDALSADVGIPVLKLIESKPGRSGRSWVHPIVAVDLAKWISPRMFITIMKLTGRFLVGDLTLTKDLQVNHDLQHPGEATNIEVKTGASDEPGRVHLNGQELTNTTHTLPQVLEIFMEEMTGSDDDYPLQGFIYFIRMTGTDYVKVGYSANVGARMSQLQTASPFPLSLISTQESSNMRADELAWHRKLAQYHVRGEWFQLSAAVILSLN